MKSFADIFKPEVSPIHKVDFSIATQLKVAGATAGSIPAGTLLKGDVLNAPTAGVVKSTVDGEATCILMHDVATEEGKTDYSVGVMIKGVVYEDVIALANGKAVGATDKTNLTTAGISFYNVNTLKK